MPHIRIYRSGELISEAECTTGEVLLSRISAEGIFLDAPCGGQGKCGKCLVQLAPEGEAVLACKTIVTGDTDVYLPDEFVMTIAGAGDTSGSSNISQNLGVAIDIGTTTVVAHLTDLDSGARIATASGVNAQRQYGADVISRIQYCIDNGHETLARLIQKQLASLISEACRSSGADAGNIKYISIAANTIMEHLAAGFSPVGMGIVPFTTVSLFGEEMPMREAFQYWDGPTLSDDARVYFAPAISAYVGGDITAGMLAVELEDNAGPVVYIDIGTNGEIAMKLGDKYLCCATAAGPAFEGAEISMGMAAINGAVNHVKWDGGLHFTVIGDVAPRGLCGSGLLDTLAVLLETGAVDETGRLLDPDEIEHDIAAHIGEIDGKNVFWLTPPSSDDSSASGTASTSVVSSASLTSDSGVYVSASDIRKLQLAKAAIAAGIQTLLHHAGVSEDDVKLFVLAGGFGSFMDQYSAARIGLFPEGFLPLTNTVGNSAGEGASICVRSEPARQTLLSIRERCEYIELSTSIVFNEQFVEQMMF